MKKVTVSCPGQKKPAKVCELIKEDSGVINMEIKFSGIANPIKINLSEYLKKLEM